MVVSGSDEMLISGRHNSLNSNNNNNNLSNLISKRDDIWIHIESRPDDGSVNSSGTDDADAKSDAGSDDDTKLFPVGSSKEIQTLRSNSSEISLVRKTESVSVEKSELAASKSTSTTATGSSTAAASGSSSSTAEETSPRVTHDDYKVAGWPPEVSRNVTHYIDLDNPNSPILKPKLGPILSKSRLGEFSTVQLA